MVNWRQIDHVILSRAKGRKSFLSLVFFLSCFRLNPWITPAITPGSSKAPENLVFVWRHHDTWLRSRTRWHGTALPLRANVGKLHVWLSPVLSHLACCSSFPGRCHCSKAHWHLQGKHALFSLIYLSTTRVSLWRTKSVWIHVILWWCMQLARQKISCLGTAQRYYKSS